MIEWLPMSAPAYRAQAGHAWTDETLLQWDISSQLRALNTALANLFRSKDAQPIEPEFIPAPGITDVPEDDDPVDMDEQREIAENLTRLWGD